MEPTLRRLSSDDYEKYLNLRLEGFQKQPMQFRYSPEDEISLGKPIISKKLVSDYINGVFHGDRLIGIGGLGFLSGSKLSHRSLNWAMYINEDFISKGILKLILDSLI